RRVFDLRLVQCVRDDCRRIVFFCSPCDHGQIYCSGECHDRNRGQRRRKSKRQYGLSFDGRWSTARRVARYRAGRAQNVTDTGRHELGPAAMVAEPAAAIPTEVMPLAREETTDERDLDGRFARSEEYPGAGDGRAERDDSQSAAVAVAVAPASDGNAARSDRAVAGAEGPR